MGVGRGYRPGMHHRPIALSTLLLLAAAGCATQYVPTERMRRLQASMDPADAANLFADSLGRRLQGAGLCRAPWRFDDPGAEVTMDGFTAQAWRAGEELGRKQEGGKTVVSYRKERYEVSGRFAAIGRIEVHADASGPCAVAVPFGQSAITLHGAGEAFPMTVAVTPPAVDELLAALAILSPKAERVVGKGR